MCLTRKRRNWYLPQTFHPVSWIVVKYQKWKLVNMQTRREGGATGALASPALPQVPGVYFLVAQELKQSAFRVLFYSNSLIV